MAMMSATGNATTGGNNVAVGEKALYELTAGNSNTVIGGNAGQKITTGSQHTIIGAYAGDAITTETTGSTLVGFNAGTGLSSGTGNTAVGTYALSLSTTTNNATVIGFGAGENSTGVGNTAVGYEALGAAAAEGSYNVAVGRFAGAWMTTGGQNVALGDMAMMGASGQAITGGNNVAVGEMALYELTSGNLNTVVGCDAGKSITSGSSNTIIGRDAGIRLTTGAYNDLLGVTSGYNYTTESSNICIRNLGVAGDSHTIRIGTEGSGDAQQNKCFIAGVYNSDVGAERAAYIKPDGQLGHNSSSRKFKENINDMGDYSSLLLNLRPVEFNYKTDAAKRKTFGLIAEEVSEIIPELVFNDEQNMPLGVRYDILPALLLNEWQKTEKKVQSLQACIASLNNTVKTLIEERSAVNKNINK